MPFFLAKPGSLGPGRQPVQVPSLSGAMVSPAANGVPALLQQSTENYHRRGMGPGPISAQMEPLARPVDQGDLEAQRLLQEPAAIGPYSNRADVRTMAIDTPQQAMQRAELMDTNRDPVRQRDEWHGAAGLVGPVAGPQMAQRAMGESRVMQQQLAQMEGRDRTGEVADAQAWSALYRVQNVMNPQQLAAIDAFSPQRGSQFALRPVGA